MKCPVCGSRIDEDATYCIDCGSVLDAAVSEDLSAYDASQGITGTHISLFSSLLAFFMFFMPWATVCGLSISGFNLATDELSTGEPSITLLFIVPISALVVFWLSFSRLRKRRSKPRDGSLSRILFSIIGAAPPALLYSIKEEIRPFLAFGFWGTLVSFFFSAIGGLLDLLEKQDS